jgi:hypothetical protein
MYWHNNSGIYHTAIRSGHNLLYDSKTTRIVYRGDTKIYICSLEFNTINYFMNVVHKKTNCLMNAMQCNAIHTQIALSNNDNDTKSKINCTKKTLKFVLFTKRMVWFVFSLFFF